MKSREMLAGPWLAGISIRRALAGGPPAGAFRILLLHDIAARHRASLARLLDHIGRTHGFLSPSEALQRVELQGTESETDSRVPCLVTFDDGFTSNGDAAETILAPRGIRAVFFVCPGLIGLAPDEQRAAVRKNIVTDGAMPDAAGGGRTLMNWDDLSALAAAGHAVGAHTSSHRRLTEISGAALEDEVGGANATIAEKLGAAPEWFAYPFGDIGSVNAEALASAARHYRVCRSGVRGLNLAGQDRLALHADHIDLGAAFAWQRLVLEGGLDRRYRAARERLATMAREAAHKTPA